MGGAGGMGAAEFQGIAVSDPECIGMDVYELTVSEDGLTLEGTAFASAEEVDMVLTRLPNEACSIALLSNCGEGASRRALVGLTRRPFR